VTGSLPLREIAAVRARLAWMREAHIWPNGLRYLWTDSYRSGDEYDTSAITHVMACTSHFPGRFLRTVGAVG
jgi:hypothetical protein